MHTILRNTVNGMESFIYVKKLHKSALKCNEMTTAGFLFGYLLTEPGSSLFIEL